MRQTLRAAVCLILLCLLSTPVCAVSVPELEALLPEGLAEAVERDGVLSGASSWLEGEARNVLYGALRSGVKNAALLVLAALLCGAADGIADAAGSAAARYVPYCGVLTSAAIATGDMHTLIGLGARTVEDLGTLARLLLPAVAAAMAAGGFVTSASVWQVTTLLVCDALCAAASRLLLPLSYCCIAASAVGTMLDEDALNSLSDGIRRLSSTALKLTLAAFTGYLSVAGVLTGSADRASIKAAKIAVSGTVPVVGGVLSDAAESVFAAAGAMRGTVGALGVFVVLAACLAPLVHLGVQFFLYKLAALASGLVGAKSVSGFLDRLGEVFALVFAVTASCAFVLLAALLVALTLLMG
ncbi:MAG: stage III sporulation protein AE [Ruminococcaceae bacterium]|nr:stage III sporulation protein AE [Oscillospiraceae bacterium]